MVEDNDLEEALYDVIDAYNKAIDELVPDKVFAEKIKRTAQRNLLATILRVTAQHQFKDALYEALGENDDK